MNPSDQPVDPTRRETVSRYPHLIQEDDLLDFRDDMDAAFCDAEERLIRFETGKGGQDDFEHIVFLVNRVRGSAEVVGLQKVAELSGMLEDILRRLGETGKMESLSSLVESCCGGFDAIRGYVDAVLEDRHEDDDPRARAIQTMYVEMKARRDRLDQKKVDRILEEHGF